MANKNINITGDDLDKPNASMVPVPENHSFRGYIRKPQINWVAVWLLCSIPGMFLLMLLIGMWSWANWTIHDFNATVVEKSLAWTFVIVIVGAVPAALASAVFLFVMRGWVWVQSSWLVRMQNNQPVDARILLKTPGNDPKDISELGLGLHYQVEQKWAEASNFRNIGGVYSPTFQQSTPQIADVGFGDDPGNSDNGPDLILPPEVDLDDIEPNIPSGHLGYGVGLNGKVITAPVGRSYHALRQGDTGSGKTTNLNGELVQIHRIAAKIPGKFEIYAGDFKGEFEATWGRSPLIVGGVVTSPAEIADMLEENMTEISTRYNRFIKAADEHRTLVRNVVEFARATGEEIPWRLVYLDEINALLGGTIPKRVRERVDAALKRGLQLGRGAGVFYECGAQYMTADLFDREGSKQFVTRAYFGGWDATAMNMVFLGKVNQAWGAEYAMLLDGTPGRGVYAGVGAPPVPFQGLNVTVDNILDAIDAVTVDTSMRYGGEPLKDARMPLQSAESTFSQVGVAELGTPGLKGDSSDSYGIHDAIKLIVETPLLRSVYVNRIRETRQLKLSKKEALNQIWGVKPGKSAGWTAASAFYDEAIRSS